MQCDVVVVGAGPGGSAAAYWLARRAIDVLLVDKVHFPRAKPCGDGLTPHAIAMLETMGLARTIEQRGRAFAGVRVLAPDGRASLFNLPAGMDGQPQQGLVIPRHDLDDILRQQAVAAGCRFLPGFMALVPHYCQGQLAGIVGQRGSHPLTIQARLVILATGSSRTLVEALGLAPDDKPSGLAMRAYLTGVSNLDEYLEIYLHGDLLPGYAWIFPAGEKTANIGVGIRLDGITPGEGARQLRAAFERFVQSKSAEGRLLGQAHGAPLCTDFPAIRTFASGALVVGEAAGLVNPLTGEGIALALESGQLAAEIANKALRAGNVSSDQLLRYDEALRQRHADYFNDARELMARLTHPTVMEAVIRCSLTDDRIKEALTSAVLGGQPRHAIALLGTVLDGEDRRSPAGPLFMINAYQPLLERCRAHMLAQVSRDTPSPPLLQMLTRGKMLRALLVFLGYQAAAGGDPAQVLAGAAGIELVHAASLIHDDIMDNAPTRRGLPALHVTLGIPRAIVCGDYLIAKAFRLLAETRATTPATHVVEAFIVGAESGIHTCAGQFQDVGISAPETLDEETYEQLVAGKTGSVIAGALKAGAALAGEGKPLLEALARYGMCAGRAFQIKDDILDFTNIPDNSCVIDHRATLPLIHAFQHSDDLGRELIRQFYNGQNVTASEMVKLLQVTGSLIYAKKVADSLVEESIQLAEAVPEVEKVLKAFARYATVRDH
ncbi:MAG: geranylgeranyl reductase family protein [Ardenticatenia bacterium]|nr:geranylgeranyl reductase family protein [Ardenticatenia bacterium]